MIDGIGTWSTRSRDEHLSEITRNRVEQDAGKGDTCENEKGLN
jgi:hypothetical protein